MKPKPSAKSGTARGYIRVSTEDQKNKGQSVETQVERIREYCAFHKLTLTTPDGDLLYQDLGISGSISIGQRPAGAALIAALMPGDAVVVTALDRAFRNVVDCYGTVEAWSKRGITLKILDFMGESIDTSTPMGKFFLLIVAGLAQLEREQIGKRMKDVLDHKRAVGERTSEHPPWGFKHVPGPSRKLTNDGRMLPIYILAEDWKEREVMAEVLQMFRNGLSRYEVMAGCRRRPFCATCKAIPKEGCEGHEIIKGFRRVHRSKKAKDGFTLAPLTERMVRWVRPAAEKLEEQGLLYPKEKADETSTQELPDL